MAVNPKQIRSAALRSALLCMALASAGACSSTTTVEAVGEPSRECAHGEPMVDLWIMRNELTIAVELPDPQAILEARPDNEPTSGGWVLPSLEVIVLSDNSDVTAAGPGTKLTLDDVWVKNSRFESISAALGGAEKDARLVLSVGPTTAWRSWWIMGAALVGEGDSLTFTESCASDADLEELRAFSDRFGHRSDLEAFAAFNPLDIDLPASDQPIDEPLPGVFADEGEDVLIAVDVGALRTAKDSALVCFAQEAAPPDRHVCLSTDAAGSGEVVEINLRVDEAPIEATLRSDPLAEPVKVEARTLLIEAPADADSVPVERGDDRDAATSAEPDILLEVVDGGGGYVLRVADR